MKYALYGLHRGSSVDTERFSARAVRAEQVGFEGLWVGDHIALRQRRRIRLMSHGSKHSSP